MLAVEPEERPLQRVREEVEELVEEAEVWDEEVSERGSL